MKCINPMKHRPEFEGKKHCSQCELGVSILEIPKCSFII
jgi:hypothetical protein